MKTVHLIGVCGTAMATLAVLLKQRGFDVRGSDQHVYPPMSQFLIDSGITLLDGYQSEHISNDLDLVVVGNAISRGNPELEAVLDQRVRYASLPEVLRNEFLWSARSVVVAGTHGKTTTAFMLAWTLTEAGVDPSFLIGGISRNLGTSGHLGTGDVFVVEGDEYDSAFFDKTAKFLKYLPEVVVVNNVEFDHADIYRDLDELRVTFRRLVRLVPRGGRLILNADDREARSLGAEALCGVETCGLESPADWQAVNIEYGASETAFDVIRQGEPVTHVTMRVLGAFNVRNALGSMAAAAAVGVAPEVTAQALQSFRGVKRRLEVRGVEDQVTVYDDFAHHPTAVRETLSAMRATMPSGRVWALFEPRSATACRRVFQKQFAESLRLADEVVVTEVHRKDIPESERLSERELVADLTAAGVAARFVPTVDDVVAVVVEDARSGDQIIAMSNGGFGGIHDRLLAALAARYAGTGSGAMPLIEGWTLSRLGDAALVVECEQRIDPDLNAAVLAVARAVRQLARPGVRDVVESYCAVTIHFDPLKTDTAAIVGDLETEVARAHALADDSRSGGRRLTVPVCYGGRYGPDIGALAAFAACTEAEVIARHSAETYRVYMLGFLPGFAYMGVVPPELAMPRRRAPRLDVPAGSVGIAGQQTGVYPLAAPGGWQLIGRTPLAPFDLGRAEPFLFRAGDMIRFEPVAPERFDELAAG